MTAGQAEVAGIPGFVHEGCLYGSDEEFLAAAVPFVTGGLARDEPVLAATTAANLELLTTALGERAHGLDLAETAYFGRRPAQRVAAFDRYYKSHLSSPGQVRILAEPVWTGRSEQEIRTWKQMEASLNLIFADTRIWMICPYDSRVLRPDILADARRTHPSRVVGTDSQPSADFTDPAAFASGLDAGPLPRPPGAAAQLTFAGDLAALRRFVAEAAGEHGVAGDDAALFVIAVAEAASHVRLDGQAVLTVWERPGALVCDVTWPTGRLAAPADPLPGLRPPELDQPQPGDGLWLARQICEQVETRSADGGCTIRLWMPTAHVLA